MNNSLHLPKIVKGRPSTITLQSLYEYIELLEKRREERVFNLQAELEACYIRKNISPHASLFKKDPYNQYIWIEITDINDKKPT